MQGSVGLKQSQIPRQRIAADHFACTICHYLHALLQDFQLQRLMKVSQSREDTDKRLKFTKDGETCDVPWRSNYQ